MIKGFENLVENRDYVMHRGYIVCRSGEIISKKSGRTVNAYPLTHAGSHVKLSINGEKVVVNKARLVFECFSGEKIDTNKYVIQFKNGDDADASYDNLYLISKKEYYDKLNCKGKKRFDEHQQKTIVNEYNAQSDQNEASVRSFAIKYGCSYITMKRLLNV